MSEININKQNVLRFNPKDVDTINPSLCPLCNKSNHCGNISSCDSSQGCWCSDETIKFSETLLSKVPSNAKGKACICKACAAKNIG